MKVGIFGGTFNPIHQAHLIIAEAIRDDFGLDRIIFIPSALPPHKDTPVVEAHHRLEMVRLACAGNPHFEVSGLEKERGGRSYSVDTLRSLKKERPAEDFFFIIGMDAFKEIGTWKEAASLFDLTSFLIIPRPGHPLSDPLSYLPPGVEGRFSGTGNGGRLKIYAVGGGRDFFTLKTPIFEISSSEIRTRIGGGRSIRYIVPAAVESYIEKEGLYKD